MKQVDVEVYDLNNTTALLSSRVCKLGVAQLKNENSQRIEQYIRCRYKSSRSYKRRFYRLNYISESNESRKKKKMFVYTAYGKQLIKKQLPNEFDFPNVSSICSKPKPSNLKRNILVVVVVFIILLLVFVYRRYHLRIHVSKVLACELLNNSINNLKQ